MSCISFLKLQVPPQPSAIQGYILAFRRSDLDLNFSSVTLIGANVSSHAIALSRASQRYDLKISAFTSQQFGDFSDLITWCSSGIGTQQNIYLTLQYVT